MEKKKRSAGVLLHISSLPSSFGIGDVGPQARAFADFLKRSGQTYWQLLPLNPTEGGQGHSPYSSISSRAGNTLFISPEMLAQHGFLNDDDIIHCALPRENKVNYSDAERIKKALYQKAWLSYRHHTQHPFHSHFKAFCTKERVWLDDFALYMLLKQQHKGQPWYEWEAKYKLRDEHTLKVLATHHVEKLEKIKWLQFIFFTQWHELRDYCAVLGVKFFGDLPFYVSYDSADVWAHKEIFNLDKEGKMLSMCGVPPDAFSADGQLWGMPIFLWDVLKERNYDWWIERLRKNMELYDVLRLDHFRAFSDYWEVPANEKTAKNGEWKTGPRSVFFKAVKKAIKSMPFIAEDLGEIDQPVYDLRDEFKLPGMKVLQFAFGGEMAESPHIPHNYSENFVAYTGTHDNNTIKGWYRQDGAAHREQLSKYTGQEVTQHNVHVVTSRMVYASVANIAILPLQDVLGLDENARMNTPAGDGCYWAWRFMPGQLTEEAEVRLKDWTQLYGR